MSTEKFTPGEWEVFHHKDECMKSFDWREIVTKEASPKAIAHMMYYEGMPQEEYEANAALIATAPEMYNKLKEVKEFITEFNQSLTAIHPHFRKKMDKLENDITELLKKARGER